MSTLAELDALAHRAAAVLLADAPAAAEADAALHAVKAGGPAPVQAVAPTTTRNRARAGRLPMLVAGAAAALIALGIAALIVLTRPQSSPSLPGGAPSWPGSPLTTIPAVGTAPAGAPNDHRPGPFTMTLTPSNAGPRQVLYAAGIGSAADELGMEECDDCESARPHDPIVADDGSIVIFDMANHRWVVVGHGPVAIDSSLEMFELERGRDGFIYTSAKVDGAGAWSIVVWDPAHLEEPVQVVATQSSGSSLALFATDEGMSYVDGLLEYLGPVPTRLGTLIEDAGTLVRTYPDGETTTWMVPADWNLDLPADVLADGSALVNVFAGNEMWLVRLFPDGRSLAMPPVQGDGVWAAPAITLDGVAVIERVDGGFEVARYELPTVAARDAAATPSTPTASTTSTAAQETGESTPFVVTTAVGPLTTPELLYSAPFGDAVDQLGFLPCQECAQGRPFEPVVTRDGTVLVVDAVNSRIVSVSAGVASTWPLAAGFSPRALALGYDEVLYVGGEYAAGSPSRRTVIFAYSSGSMVVPLQEIAFGGTLAGDLRAMPTGLAAGGSADAVVPYIGDSEAPRHASVELAPPADDAIRGLTVRDTNGAAVTWTLAEGWMVGGLAVALDHPEAVIAAAGPGGEAVFARLFADGTSLAMPYVRSDGNGSPPFIDDRGIVRLQQTGTGFDVVRYPLPA